MTRRAAPLAVVLALGWTVALVGLAPGAGAEAATAQGWWTAANPGGTPVAPPAPPDVPADGLLVQGGSSDASPTAYAALVYDVPAGASVGPLTLAVAAGSGSTPAATPRACPLTSSFTPAQGGPMAGAPAYDCAKKATGKPSSSSDKYEFDVSAFVADGILAVAIVPGSATDRVVFTKPAADSLPVTQAAESAPASDVGSSDTGAGTGDAATPVPAGTGSATLPADTATATPAASAAESQARSAVAAPAAGSTPAARSAAPAAVQASATGGHGGAKPALIGLGLGGVLIAIMLWSYAGRSAAGALHDPS